MKSKGTVVFTNNFKNDLDSLGVSKLKCNRMVCFFEKKPVGFHFSKLVKSGFSYKEVLENQFTQRFGNKFIVYHFENISGYLQLIITKILEVLLEKLTDIASYYSKSYRTTVYYKTFIIFICGVEVCIHPAK